MNKIQFELSKVPKNEWEDCKRIVKAVLNQGGIVLSLSEAYEAWEEYSSDREAQWITVPDNEEEVWRCISGVEPEYYI